MINYELFCIFAPRIIFTINFKLLSLWITRGISEKLILRWTNHADLFRINGVGPQFAELLEKAGVDTVKEFRHRVAENLQPKLEEINAEFHICGRVPAASEVQKMIDQAKELEPKVTY